MENFKPKKYEDHLMSAYAFDETDLAANEEGRYTQRQLDRIERQRRRMTSIWTLLLLIDLFGFAFVLPLLAVSAPLFGLIPALIFMIAATVGCYFAGRRAFLLRSEINDNRIETVEGQVNLSNASTQNVTLYYMKVDDERFQLNRAMFYAMKNGDPYRVHFTPRSHKILSVVWLRDGEDNLLDTNEIKADASSPSLMSQEEQSSLSNRR